MLRTFAVLICCLALPVLAQEAPKPPAGISSLARLLAKKAGPPVEQATRFKPRKQPVLLDDIANSLGQDDEQRTALREVFQQGVPAVEAKLAEAGHANDVAAALAFAIAVNWGAWKGEEVSDPASEALLKQLQAALGTPEFRALKDLEKQKAYEYPMALGLFTAVMLENAGGDKDTLAGAKAFAGEVLKLLLGVDPATVELTESGLQAAGGAAAASAAGAPLVVGTPDGWLREDADGMVVLSKSMPTRNDKNEPLTVRVIVSTEGASSQDVEKDLHAAYDKLLRPLIPADATPGGVAIKDARPDVCRRFVGNGLRCQFAGVSWSKRESGLDYFGTSQELHLYFVESGGRWFPVVAQLAGLKGPLRQGGQDVMGGARHDWLEEVWAKAHGEASQEPLFAPAELVGHWELSSSSAGPFYYNAMTGASMGMSMVVRNHKVDRQADGTWSSVFVGGSGIGSVQIATQKLRGTWELKNDQYGCFLVRTGEDGAVSQNRILGLYGLPDGRRVYVELLPNDFPSLPVLWQNGDRYFKAKD